MNMTWFAKNYRRCSDLAESRNVERWMVVVLLDELPSWCKLCLQINISSILIGYCERALGLGSLKYWRCPHVRQVGYWKYWVSMKTNSITFSVHNEYKFWFKNNYTPRCACRTSNRYSQKFGYRSRKSSVGLGQARLEAVSPSIALNNSGKICISSHKCVSTLQQKPRHNGKCEPWFGRDEEIPYKLYDQLMERHRYKIYPHDSLAGKRV